MKPVVLIIMDGWGVRKQRKGNAPKIARTPNLDYYSKNYPYTTLYASGEHVGLPKKNQGSSEVGHLNIGAGRMVVQNLVRINQAIRDKSFFRNKELLDAIRHCRKKQKTLHVMGLLQDQGVHAHQRHLYAILKMARGIKVAMHVFTDGRDTPPKSAMGFLRQLKVGVATVSGRYYAMDRDNRWNRTKMAYIAVAEGIGKKARTAKDAVTKAYARGETDEFIKPTVIGDYPGMKQGDAAIFFNFRFDRARQLTKAFVDSKFDGFKRVKKDIRFTCMTEYYKGLKHVAFKPLDLGNNLGMVLSKKGIRQLRISETEKYAHVTFFFNGLVEKPCKGETRILIHSPKVATYDKQPEMSVYKIAERLIKELPRYGAVIANFVNGDMVGHTGNLKAAVQACEAVDECVGMVVKKTLSLGGVVIITADHGNCENMNPGTSTAHTTGKVPFMVVSNSRLAIRKIKDASLKDIAPTFLELLGIPKQGKSLITKA